MGIAVEAVERPGEGTVWRWRSVNEKSHRGRLGRSLWLFSVCTIANVQQSCDIRGARRSRQTSSGTHTEIAARVRPACARTHHI